MKNLPALKVWLKFCDRFKIAESSVPLFEANDLVVATHQIGLKNPRAVLSRSAAMEAMLLVQWLLALAVRAAKVFYAR